MAKGDIWTCAIVQLNVRSEPHVDSPIIGVILKGQNVTELEQVTSDDGKVWIKHNEGGGYSQARYMEKKMSSENSEEPSEEEADSQKKEEENSGYLPDANILFETLGITEDEELNSRLQVSSFSNIKSVMGVFGLPYQFLPNTDSRIVSNNKDSLASDLGYEYAQKIIERIPLLFLAPGKANFMKKYSKKEKENILEKIINLGTGADTVGDSLDDLIDGDGRYYTFEYDPKRYYQYLNPMCRMAARYMNIEDVVIGGEPLDRLNWERFTQQHITSIGTFGSFTSIPFYVNAETSISESMTNSTTQSMIASTVNSISDMGRELGFLLGSVGAATGIEALEQDADVASNIENVQNTISKLMGRGNFLSNLASHLGTVAAGGKLMFPEIWADSQFSRSYNCTIKLIAPDPSPLSVYLNVIAPLLHLIALVAPQSINANPNSYANPFLVRAVYKGFFNIDTGIITDMSVTKGAECQWTPEGIPTSIEVSIGIKDLYNAMAITSTKAQDWKYDTMNNTALMDYIANLCGINIFKPEISRLIEMWYVNNFENRVADFFQVNIWQGISSKIQNIVMGIYRG